MSLKAKIKDLYLTTLQLAVEYRNNSRLARPSAAAGDTAQHVENMRISGFSVIENYFTSEQCRNMIGEMDRSFTEYSRFLWSDEQHADTRLFGAEQTSEGIAGFHRDPQLLQLANIFNGSATANFSTLAGRLTAVENNLGSGGGWHRDTPYESKQFKALVYLSDVSEDEGPFQYISGTHKKFSLYKNILKAGLKYGQNRISDEEVNEILRSRGYKLFTFPARAGTCILVNTFGIHRGMPIKKNTRYALTNYYYPEDFIKENKDRLIGKFNPVR